MWLERGLRPLASGTPLAAAKKCSWTYFRSRGALATTPTVVRNVVGPIRDRLLQRGCEKCFWIYFAVGSAGTAVNNVVGPNQRASRRGLRVLTRGFEDA